MRPLASLAIAVWLHGIFLVARESASRVSTLRSTNEPNAGYPFRQNENSSAASHADREVHFLGISHTAVMITRKKRSTTSPTEPSPPNENGPIISDLYTNKLEPDFGPELSFDGSCSINVSSCKLYNLTLCGRSSGGHCNCDVLCVVYGDCCEDFLAVCPDTHTQALATFGSWALPEITCLPQVKAKMVKGCPSRSHALQANCTKGVKANNPDFMPVLDSNNGIDYVNSFCALCNGADRRKLVSWTLTMRLKSQTDKMMLTDAEEIQTIETALNGVAKTHLGEVVFSWLPPEGKITRGCIVDVVQSCPDTSPANSFLVLACKNAVSYVQSDQASAQVFANRYCLLCNGLRSCIRPQHSLFIPDRGSMFSLLVQWQHPSRDKNVTLSNSHPSINSAWTTGACVRSGSSKRCRVTECIPTHELHHGNCVPAPSSLLYFVFVQLIDDHDVFGLQNASRKLDREFKCNCMEEEITLKACNFPESTVNFFHKLWEVVAASVEHAFANPEILVCTTSLDDFDGNWTMKLTVNFTATVVRSFLEHKAEMNSLEAIKSSNLSFMREKASNETAVIICIQITKGRKIGSCPDKHMLQLTNGDALSNIVINNSSTIAPDIHANHAEMKAAPFYLCMFYMSLTAFSCYHSVF